MFILHVNNNSFMGPLIIGAFKKKRAPRLLGVCLAMYVYGILGSQYECMGILVLIICRFYI